VTSVETDAFRWAVRTLDRINDPDLRHRATELTDRQVKRWKGERPAGDFYRDPAQQIIENAAASLGIDLSDESDPIVQGLRIAARDNTPERALRTCEHLVSTRGATGPAVFRIEQLFGIQTAGSKIIHCVLHNYHVEAKDLDSALAEFKSKYCDSCSDRSPRPTEWKYDEAFRIEFEAKHIQFVRRFNATGAGFRIVPSD